MVKQNGTIHCDVDGDIDIYYWYLGSSVETKPILVLDHGERNGTKYGDAHYDINDKGEMKIINAKMEHAGNYTFAVVSQNQTLQQVISVEITGEMSYHIFIVMNMI